MPNLKQPLSFDQISVHRWRTLPDPGAVVAGIDEVFFESSGTKSFESAAAREDFRARWLGRYLAHDPDYVYVAIVEQSGVALGDSPVVGYLVGAIDDPALSERFADLGYFQRFKSVTALYPAQLHVNLLSSARGHGLGQRLVEMFVSDIATDHGVEGVHVVTGEGARNISFYAKCGFHEVAKTDWNGRTLVFLGRKLPG